MASNVVANPGTAGATFKTTDNAGVHTPHSNIDTLPALPAGTNNIGDVDVLTLPALPAGGNNIGDVDVLTVPADPFGANADAASATGSIAAKLRFIAATGIPVTALPAVTGAVTANAGTNLNTSTLALEVGGNLAAVAASASVLDDWDETDRAKVNLIAAQAGVDGNSGVKSAATLRVVIATDQPQLTNKLLVTPDSVALPANQSVNNNQVVGTTIDVNSGVKSAGTQRIVIATDQPQLTNALKVDGSAVTQPVSGTVTATPTGTYATKETRSATGTTSQVADTATSTTILASNANRLGATVQNDSTAALYLKFGTTASLTDYTVKLVTNAYYEVPFGYTGRIDGIWATDPNTGAARVTELS